jgi:hypothetical protein
MPRASNQQSTDQRFWYILALLGAIGCTAGERPAEARVMTTSQPLIPDVRSDGDVTVMEHPAGAYMQAPQFTIEATPLSVIGGAGGDPQYDLTYASYVIPLADGRVMTFARIGNKVFVFGRDGQGERTIGRTGQGPGDWMRFGDPVLLANDTVLVLDFANNRLNWVTADGGVVRTAPYVVSGDLRRMSHISGFLPSGELVMHSAGTWGGHQTDSLQRSLARILASNLTTAQTRTIATVPDIQGVKYETRFRGRASSDWRPLRLGGYAQVAVWDSVIVTAIASSPEVDLRDSAGVVRARLRPGVRRRPVTETMRAAQIEQELRQFDGAQSERMVDPEESRRIAREAPFADSLPYFEYLIRGSDGTLWVVHAIAPGDSSWSATAVRKDGAIVGHLRVPGTSRPMAFGNGTVIVRARDENDVVSFRVYRLVPAEKRLDTDRPK